MKDVYCYFQRVLLLLFSNLLLLVKYTDNVFWHFYQITYKYVELFDESSCILVLFKNSECYV